jgi:1-aminocyclopropane-1-carboxylate deaminase
MEQIETSWSKEAGINLLIKRDDLIHPIISGNKWRKLRGVFDSFGNEHISEIVTYGGAYSNHIIAVACYANLLGIRSKGMIRGEKPQKVNTVLRLAESYNMKLEYISRKEYASINSITQFEDGVLTIAEGGAGLLGTIGCQHILEEVETTIDQVFVACGTGTTLAGMQEYANSNRAPYMLTGVQVLKGENYISNEVKSDYGLNVNVLDQYHLGGYAKTNKELFEFIGEFLSDTNILLDPIYTGKVGLAIKKLSEDDYFKSGESVLLIHTGGLTGWYGKWDEFKVLEKQNPEVLRKYNLRQNYEAL